MGRLITLPIDRHIASLDTVLIDTNALVPWAVSNTGRFHDLVTEETRERASTIGISDDYVKRVAAQLAEFEYAMMSLASEGKLLFAPGQHSEVHHLAMATNAAYGRLPERVQRKVKPLFDQQDNFLRALCRQATMIASKDLKLVLWELPLIEGISEEQPGWSDDIGKPLSWRDRELAASFLSAHSRGLVTNDAMLYHVARTGFEMLNGHVPCQVQTAVLWKNVYGVAGPQQVLGMRN